MWYKLILSMLLIGSLNAQQLAQLRVLGKAQKSPDEFVAKRDANGRYCAMIKVISDMEGFQYDAYNGVVAVEDQPGQDLVYLQPDERVLEIFHSGYEPLKLILSEYGIQLKPRQVWSIKISGVGKAANTLPVTFLVQPQDAQIEVDGVAAQHGKPIDLSPGRHQLKIYKEGYRPIEKEIQVSKSQVLFNFTLQEVQLQPVTIKSQPAGAQIYINGVLKGKTDYGFWLYPGDYQLKLSLPGYVEVNQTITVRENQNNEFSFTLLKNAGYLQVTLDPPDAQLLINGQAYQPTGKIALAPGAYQVVVTKNGYLEQRDEVQIKIGQTVTRHYTLTKNAATLQVQVSPANAQLLINKEDYSGRSSIELPPGTYKIEVLAKGFYPQSATIQLKRGQVIRKEFNLQQMLGSLRFSVTPVFANVRLMRNGRTVQSWQGLKLLKDLPVGEYLIEASANGYSTERKTITIRDKQTTSVEIKLRKGVFFTGTARRTSATGRLKLNATPPDAQITVDGKPIPDTYLILPVGSYTVRCEKSGYYAQEKKVHISRNQETALDFNLQRKTKGKGIVRSLFFPGWGQSYMENGGRGLMYKFSFLLSAAGAYYFTNQYNKSVKDYDTIHEQYLQAVDYRHVLELGDQMESKYKKVEDNEKLRNYLYAATAAVWAINVLDAMILPPGWKTSAKFSINSAPNGIGINIAIR